MTRQVVDKWPQAYLAAMPAARLLRFLTILALVLMPLGMIPGSHGAASAHAATMVQPVQAMSEHCADMGGQPAQPQPDHAADCAIACSALPSIGTILDAPPLAPALVRPAFLSPAASGLHPEAATPPPRFS